MLEVSVATQEDIAQIYLQGRFDGLGAQLFDQEVEARIKSEIQWLIDFSNVVYLSSAGIRSLLKYGKKIIKDGGKLILSGLTREVKLVLETTGVLQLFGQAEGMDEALATINKERCLDNAYNFKALDRECTWQSLAAQACYLDIWNPLQSTSLQNLTSAGLMAASLEDLNMAWGIGGLGFDRVSAFEGMGSFITLDKVAGVLPADTYNQPDFMVIKNPREAVMYVAAAVGFSGPPWGKLDLPPGRPVNVREIQNLIIARLREEGRNTALLGLVIVGQVQPGSASYYHNYEDLINNRPLSRELAGSQPIMLFGLGADADWEADEHLSILLAQRGIKPGEEFFLGNALSFADPLDWNHMQMPGEVMEYCTDLELMQDVIMADENTAITEGRVWFLVPGSIRSGKEKQLQVQVKGEIPFPEEWEIITRRLYTDAHRVVLEPLTGGFSPAKPFRVSSYDNDNRRMLPTVLKLGPTPLIEKEIQNHQKYVHGYILNNSTTIMGQSTCRASTGMRYSFVGISGPDSNLSWLTNRFREKPAEELLPLFDKIFTRILKPWYGQPRWEMIKPYQEHDPLPLFPILFDAAEKELGISAEAETIDCPELGLTLPNPYYFLKHEYPARQSVSQLWYTGINHGDLNMQNILLDEQDNVYIIDFSETRPRNIVSDFARLEPIFKFEMTRMGSEADLVSFLELEQALTQVNSLEETPPFSYSGGDPAMAKVYTMICRIRKYAKTAVIFETDIIPYLLALLEWTLPIVVFVNVTPIAKKAATYSAALIVDQMMRLEACQ
ncbi:MAG TPA: STAS domain-containing protein [Syntrophomonas sp.]|nr:STAS domain-containing protein [Syntrophomonas sp.]